MLSLMVLLSLGCVPKAEYDALQAEFADARTTHERAVAEQAERLATCEQELAGARGDLQTAEAAIAELEGDVRALDDELETVRAEKAALVKDRSRLSASVSEMEDALAELAERKRAAEKRVEAYRDLLARFEALIDAGRLRVKIVDGRMVVEMATDILFDSGSAALSDDGREALLEVAGVLSGIPDRRYQVEGHTDDVPIDTDRFPSNWWLAAGRAITVVNVLGDGGVDTERLSAASYADHQPVASNESDEGRSENRRIEIVVVPDLSQLPGFEELQQLADEG